MVVILFGVERSSQRDSGASQTVSQVVFLFLACKVDRRLVVGVSLIVAFGTFLSPRGRASFNFLGVVRFARFALFGACLEL